MSVSSAARLLPDFMVNARGPDRQQQQWTTAVSELQPKLSTQ
jgi:hypothetical protein